VINMRLCLLSRIALCVAAAVVPLAMTLAASTPGTDPMVGGVPLSQVATSTVTLPADSYYVGEVFTLTHRVVLKRGVGQALADAFNWPATGFNADEWSAPVQSSTEEAMIFTQTTRAYGVRAATGTLPPATQDVTLITGTTASSFVSQTETDKFTLHTKMPPLTLRPLPAPAPTNFSGGVGDFTLTAKLSGLTAKVGDSVTWSLTLTGSGNWPEIRRLPPRTISKELDFIKPVIKKDFQNGSLFQGSLTEDMLLIPTRAGSYQLGPVRFVYFDPKIGKYQMLTSETFKLTVTGAALGPAKSPSQPGGIQERVPVPDAPPPLPLDPIASRRGGIAPFVPRQLAVIATVPLVALILFWLWLAAQRRWLTDPLHERRSAGQRVAAMIRDLQTGAAGSPAAVRERLYAWQRAVTAFGGFTVSTPTPSEIGRVLDAPGTVPPEATWKRLWREANHVLFSESAALPADWPTRAKATLAASALPRVPLVAMFAPRNLLPFLVLLMVGLIPCTLRADAADDAYLHGDFPAAEKIWRAMAADAPTDARARYNLSLALAQQDRWSEAASQALAAFCLAPRDPAIRWQFELTLDRSGIDHPIFNGLAHGEGLYRIARVFSPASWGLMLCAASLIFALATGAVIFGVFRNSGSRSVRRGWGLVALAGLLVGGAAVLSLRLYGPLADRAIVVVGQPTLLRTVPTDANTLQKTASLPAGTMAHVGRSFLGWSQLTFPNGQTGWIRTEILTSLYR
jgi:hypothetical protein